MNVKMIDNLIEIEIFINKMGVKKENEIYYTIQGKILSTLKRLEKVMNIDDSKNFSLAGKLEYAVKEISKIELEDKQNE